MAPGTLHWRRQLSFPDPAGEELDSQWYFDTEAGKEEILARHIGRNELLAMDACAALADAENQMARETRQRVCTADHQQRRQAGWPVLASIGKVRPQVPLAILAELPKSSLRSLVPGKPFVMDGYILRILTAQDDAAPGGAKGYIVNGKMTGGFAILATPVKYGVDGHHDLPGRRRRRAV